MPEPTPAQPAPAAPQSNGAPPAEPPPPAPVPTSADLQTQARAAIDAAATPAPDADPPPPEPGETAEAKLQRMAVQYGKIEQKLRNYEKQTLPELQQQAEAHTQLLARFQDPAERYKAFQELGGDYREWTDQVLASDDAPQTPEQKELAELKATVATLTKQGEVDKEANEKAEQQAQFTRQLGAAQVIVAEDERFAFTKATGRADAIIQEYQELINTGQPVSDEIAALAVEAKLVKTMQPQLEALSKVPRFQEMMKECGFTYGGTAPPPPPDPNNTLAQQATAQGAPKPPTAPAPLPTLNNGLSAEPAESFSYAGKSKTELRDNARRVANQVAVRQAEKRSLQE